MDFGNSPFLTRRSVLAALMLGGTTLTVTPKQSFANEYTPDAWTEIYRDDHIVALQSGENYRLRTS